VKSPDFAIYNGPPMLRTIRTVECIALTIIALATQCVSQANPVKKQSGFATNECFAKGGLGIIRENLYIDLKSENSALVLNDGKRWNSGIAPKPEVVIFFDNKVWSPQALPERFDLSDAVVISFETTKVRFFDYSKMSGGYYKRRKPK
jgi:hypothetical protein